MDSTPENLERIRCGMCGTLNPADAVTCEHCGARLRPMTPEELGLTPSEDSTLDSLGSSPSEGDPLDALRAQTMESYDEETIVGPSAHRQALPSEESTEDVEPDFTIGGQSWLDSQDLEPTEDARSIIPDWLAGMDSVDAPQAETEGVSEPSPEPTMPDWLRDAYGASSEETSVPPTSTPTNDELEILRPPEDLPIVEPDEESPDGEESLAAAPLIDAGVPDWLKSMEDETPVAEADLSSASPTELTERTEALSELGTPQNEESSEMPAWLGGLGLGGEKEDTSESGHETPESAAESASPLEIETPAWLEQEITPQMPDEDLAEVEASIVGSEDVEEEQQTPTPESGDDAEMPAWLAGLGGEELSVPEEPGLGPSAMESGSGVDVPDWLAGLSGEESVATEEPAPAPSSMESGEDVDVPEWLAGLSGEESAATEEAEPAPFMMESGEDVDVPDWLAGLSGEESPASKEAETSPPMMESDEDIDVPDWLGVSSVQESDVPQEEPLVPQMTSPAETDKQVVKSIIDGDIDSETPDWLDALDEGFTLSPEGSPAPATGEDLLGLSGDLAMPLTADEEEENDLEAENLPTWLRSSTRESAVGTPAGEELPEGMLSEMASLRFESIAGRGSSESNTETVGALKDVTGVIRPEVLFTGTALQAGQIVDHVLVSPEQHQRIQILQALFERTGQGVTVTPRTSAFPLVRWITALILVVAISVAALAGVSLLSSPSMGEGPQNVHSLIESIPSNSIVVMVFEYEGDTAAELQPLSATLMEHLARRGAIVYTISSRPTGPAMAENALTEVNQQTETPGWVNLGYLAGGTKGISALTVGTLPGVVSPFAFDYQNQSTDLTSGRLADLNPALLIIVAARAEDMRAWVEQISPTVDTPIVAAMSVGSAPMAAPYVQSGQVTALLSGVNDAVSYRTLENQTPSTLLAATWNAQALGGAAAAAMILLGAMFNILRSFRQSQE